jgi:predicted amidophosphoribosyltransferase
MCDGELATTGVCENCSVPFSRAWCVGVRDGSLQRLVGLYKFQNAYAARYDIVDLLDARIDSLPLNTIVIPVPTIRRHIRERGYDHVWEVAKLFAKRRGLKLSTALQRSGTTKQRGMDRVTRDAQAKHAFVVNGVLDPVPYLLIDDVVTTGATVQYAAKALIDAGASAVWVGVVCRQSLD